MTVITKNPFFYLNAGLECLQGKNQQGWPVPVPHVNVSLIKNKITITNDGNICNQYVIMKVL